MWPGKTGTTGARGELSPALPGLVERARRLVDVPLYAGFGISTPEHARAVGEIADGIVVALLVKDRGKEQPTRFEATLQPDGTFRPRTENRYEAEGGKRYMDEVALGKVYRVRSFAYLGNFFANFLHLALWAVVLWAVMRFALSHAIGFGLLFWAVTMLVVQPTLFGMVTK